MSASFVNGMTLHQVEAFRDGAISPVERLFGERMAAHVRHAEEQRRHCRIGRVFDRRPVSERMAQVMVRCFRAKGTCTTTDLHEAGFTRDDLAQHAMLARGIAARLVDRQQDGE